MTDKERVLDVALLAPRGSLLVDGPQGGSSYVLEEDARILREAGFRVTVWAPPGSTSALVTRTQGIRFRKPLLSSLEYCGHFVKANHGAVLLAYNEPTVAVLAPERTIVRFDWPTPLPRYAPWPVARRRFLRARYLFPSQALRDLWLARHTFIPLDRTVVLANAIDSKVWGPAPPPPEQPLRVGFAGQWVPEKGLQVLLSAWPEVEREVGSAELLLAGGPALWQRTNPAPGARELAERVTHMRSFHRIVVVGVMPRQGMPAFWRQVHVAAVPSVCAESFGLVALEAMACGRPIVASAVGALPEVVGDAGILVPPEDPVALAEALIGLLSDTRKREDLGTKAAARARMFSLEERAKRLVELVREVARGANLRPC